MGQGVKQRLVIVVQMRIRLSGGNNTISTEAGADVVSADDVTAQLLLRTPRSGIFPRRAYQALTSKRPFVGVSPIVFTLGGKGRISFILSGPSHEPVGCTQPCVFLTGKQCADNPTASLSSSFTAV